MHRWGQSGKSARTQEAELHQTKLQILASASCLHMSYRSCHYWPLQRIHLFKGTFKKRAQKHKLPDTPEVQQLTSLEMTVEVTSPHRSCSIPAFTPPLLLSESQASHHSNRPHLLPPSRARCKDSRAGACSLRLSVRGSPAVPPGLISCGRPCLKPSNSPSLLSPSRSSAFALFQAACSRLPVPAAVCRFPALLPHCQFLWSNLWLSVQQGLSLFCHAVFSRTFPPPFPMSAASYIKAITDCTPVLALESLTHPFPTDTQT